VEVLSGQNHHDTLERWQNKSDWTSHVLLICSTDLALSHLQILELCHTFTILSMGSDQIDKLDKLCLCGRAVLTAQSGQLLQRNYGPVGVADDMWRELNQRGGGGARC